jgi:Glycosyl transferase family 2
MISSYLSVDIDGFDSLRGVLKRCRCSAGIRVSLSACVPQGARVISSDRPRGNLSNRHEIGTITMTQVHALRRVCKGSREDQLHYLASLRGAGWQFVVLPKMDCCARALSPDMRDSLIANAGASIVFDGPTCSIIDLRVTSTTLDDNLPTSVGRQTGADSSPLAELISLTIPLGSQIVIPEDCVDDHVNGTYRIAQIPLIRFQEQCAEDSLIALLDTLSSKSRSYLVLPSDTICLLDSLPKLKHHIEVIGSLVAAQADIGVIYALYRIQLSVPRLKPRVVAVIAAHNEERMIEVCLAYYIRNGVSIYMIDNGSTDRTVELASSFLGRGLLAIESLSHDGVFRLDRIDRMRKQIIDAVDTDWVIYSDADEFRFGAEGLSLAETCGAVDKAGYNAINFFEFVFVPTEQSPVHCNYSFRDTMRWYYPFAPCLPWRISAWKKSNAATMVSPHRTQFRGMRLCPRFFPLEHYQYLSFAHAAAKYGRRHHDERELASGLHGGYSGWRERYSGETFLLPQSIELAEVTDAGDWDLRNIRSRHHIDCAIASAQAAEVLVPRDGAP